jgi:hypothetical protein
MSEDDLRRKMTGYSRLRGADEQTSGPSHRLGQPIVGLVAHF